MTREEAMYLLNNLRSVAEGKEDEAIDTAIEALSSSEIPTESTNTPTNTPTDLISRADAIEALGEEPEVWTDTEEEWAYRNAWVEHISAIKSLPSATCDDCIWHVCNYNKIDWDGEDGYISRQDAIDAIRKNVSKLETEDSLYFNLGLGVAEKEVEEIPSAEPNTGKWIDKGDYAECSNCGADSGTQFDGVEPVPRKSNFCPNCGARITGYER